MFSVQIIDVVIFFTFIIIALEIGVELLDVPDKTIFFRVARSTDVLMIIKHDVLIAPSVGLFVARVDQEIHFVIGVQYTVRNAELVEV